MGRVGGFLLWSVVMTLVFTVVFFAIIHLDLFFNGNWIMSASASWQWYNYFTSHHGLTMLYLHSNPLWLLPGLVFGIVSGISIAVK